MVKSWINKIRGRRKAPEAVPVIPIEQLEAYGGQVSYSDSQQSIWDGGKFYGGFGPTQLWDMDYWTLRERSEQLFTENLYAAGLIKRLITNEIGPGLWPEFTPFESILGLPDDSLADWTETVETRFSLWGNNRAVCDSQGQYTWGALNRIAKTEAYISGDILVVLQENTETKRPSVQLISGRSIQSPMISPKSLKKGHKIEYGVELDSKGRQVGYWSGETRIAAFGSRTGRRVAWLVYGTDKRLGKTRGLPILSLVLQSLKEIDRYRDSVQRKAVINSIIAGFVSKEQDKPGSLPAQGGAVRRNTADVVDSDGKTRKFNIAAQLPGVFIEELNFGEKPVFNGGSGTDINFGTFEEAIVSAIAWANEVPPEILKLAFSNNYAASQASINEFKIYLNKVWSQWGEDFCAPIAFDWFMSEVLYGSVKADGFLVATRDPSKYDIVGAWTACEWYGSIKPSTDMLKQYKGSKGLVDEGWSTNAREARVTTGTKFSQNIKRLKRENQLKAEAKRPLLELAAEIASKPEETAAIFKIFDEAS